MALALNEALGTRIEKGLCISFRKLHPVNRNWTMFGGGHPVPNSDSLRAAQACFELLQQANSERALVIFAVSGGGSAMLEWPVNQSISLENLQDANRALVLCGATIAEINVVRRAFSAVKGGKLAAFAPMARIITLIISDTNPGDEASVASGPTLLSQSPEVSAAEVVLKYNLASQLPESILDVINGPQEKIQPHPNATHYVLADNHTALKAAAEEASFFGFRTVVVHDICEQEISEGCALLLARLQAEEPPVCLISGGEFSCPVHGTGRGGRNLETVVRCAMDLDPSGKQIVVLSEATDGLDGNSGAAGGIADNETLLRAQTLGLNPSDFLTRSDSFNFLEPLGDAFGQGPTHTNVRDIRILLKTNRNSEAGLNFVDFVDLSHRCPECAAHHASRDSESGPNDP